MAKQLNENEKMKSPKNDNKTNASDEIITKHQENRKFPAEVSKKLESYVYLLKDPRKNEFFYVGKGKGNRCFDHLKEADKVEKTGVKLNNEKINRILDIRESGFQTGVYILSHNLSDNEIHSKKDSVAHIVETAVIDTLSDFINLTNIQKGHKSSQYGLMSVNEVCSKYLSKNAKEIDLSELPDGIAIISNKFFSYDLKPSELYDATRTSWVIKKQNIGKIPPKKNKKTGEIEVSENKVKYAYVLHDNIIQEVYKVIDWYPGGTTLNSRFTDKKEPIGENGKRWEFIGQIDPENSKKYKHRSLSNRSHGIPFLYTGKLHESENE